MREIQASAAKTHLPQLLDDVERGETLIITRHGRAIARLVPEAAADRAAIRRTLDEMRRRRKGAPPITAEEILAFRDEGRP